MASTHRIKNSSNTLITVVMDSFREAHEVAPGMQVVFVNANPLDQPTFHVFEDRIQNGKPNADKHLTSEKNYAL